MKLKLSFLLFCLVTFPAIEARADAFVLPDVGGQLWVTAVTNGIDPPMTRRPPGFRLSGPGLSVSRLSTIFGPWASDLGNVQARDICLNGYCGPGTVLATNSYFSGTL